MKKWFVGYSEHRIMEIEIEAKDEDEARQLIEDGDADFDTAREVDAEITSVNDVELSCDDGNDDGDVDENS